MERIVRHRPGVALLVVWMGAAVVPLAPDAVVAQNTPKTFFACYVPATGTVYRIKEPGLPDACKSTQHVEFSWIDGLPGYDHGLLNGREDDDHPQYLLADGTRALAGHLNAAGSFKVIGLAAGTEAGDAVRFEQAVKSGDVAGGDLSGAYPNPTVSKLQGHDVSRTAPELKQVLTFNGKEWAPMTPSEGVTDHGQLSGLTDDDHPHYLLTDGVRAATNGFAVSGTLNTGTIPAAGAGVRLMWYPGKAAFRAGEATGAQWDDANVGARSAALGANTTASGGFSTAMGSSTTASGDRSTAMGLGSTASGLGSTAMGDQTTASGSFSTAMGGGTTASGSLSTAMGRLTTAQASASLVIGRFNVVEGSTGLWVSTDPLFVAGNGSGLDVRSNALTLLKDGNLTIAGSLTQASDIRLKEEIEPLDGVLQRVLELTPVRYRFREGTGHPREPKIGLSAQAVEPLFPELVQRGGDGYLSVAYAELAAVLVRAIQEQQAEIEALRQLVEALRAESSATGRLPPAATQSWWASVPR